jgi:hypothetical protein
MDADVAVTDPRVEPITRPQDRFIGVHLRSSAAKISCLRRCLRVCGASRGFAGMSGFMDAMYWSGSGPGKAPGSRSMGSIRDCLDGAVAPGSAVGSGFMGWIRGNAGLGFCAGAVGGSGFMGWIRENVDLGFCVGAVGRSGFMGWIRGNVELRVCAGAAGGSGFVRDGLNGAVGASVGAPLRRAVGGRAQSGDVGGKRAVREAVAGVRHDRDWRGRGRAG